MTAAFDLRCPDLPSKSFPMAHLNRLRNATAFANSENAKWPVAEVSHSHALSRLTVCGWGGVGIPYGNAWPMSRCAPMMSAAIWHQISIEKRLTGRENGNFRRAARGIFLAIILLDPLYS